MDEIKKGMVVQLKSGGPKMTVKEVSPDQEIGGSIFCEWFYKDKLEYGSFHPESLNIIKEK